MPAQPATKAAPKALDLDALGVISGKDAASNAYARVLLIGAAKAGKTTAVLATAPDALHINCDGASASKMANNLGAEFHTLDYVVTTRAALRRAIETSEKLVAAGVVRTVVLDSITLLCDNLLDEISVTMTGYDVWNELADHLCGAVKKLCKLDAHIFVIAHMDPSEDEVAGITPAIKGQSKVRIPAMLDDWILLDVEPGRKPERQFLLGAQKTWSHSGRNIKRSCAIDATVPVLFKELGLAL